MSDGFFERVDLPSGGWVELRPAKAVSERLRRPVVRLMNGVDRTKVEQGQEADFTDEEIDRFMLLNDTVAVTFIAQWSYEVPVAIDTIQDLPGEDYDFVRNLVAPKIGELFPNSADGAADPKAPPGSSD